MTGREERAANDLFFTCSLIEYIARLTKNHAVAVVDALGCDRVAKIYELADVYHSDNIDRVAEDFIAASGLRRGEFDSVAAARYSIPSHWDMGRIYKRLILGIMAAQNLSVVEALFAAYHSFVSAKLEDYNSSFYYDAPQNILNAYLTGEIE